MKKYGSLLMIWMLAVCMLPFTAQAGDPYWRGYAGGADSVPVYAAAKKNAKEIGRLHPGTEVYGNARGSYVEVMLPYEERLGYMRVADLQEIPPETKRFSVFAVTGDEVPLYQDNSEKSRVIARHAAGSLGYVMGEMSSGLAYVAIGEMRGFVPLHSIRKTGQETQAVQYMVELPLLEEKTISFTGQYLMNSATGYGLSSFFYMSPYEAKDGMATLRIAAYVGAYAQLTTGAFLPVGYIDGSYQPQMAYVSNPQPYERLNLRWEPSKDGHLLAKFYTGVPVQVLSRIDGWAAVVMADNRTGYVLEEFLRLGAAEKAPSLPQLRAKRGVDTYYDSQGERHTLHLKKGEIVDVLGMDLGYSRDTCIVRYQGLYLPVPLADFESAGGDYWPARVSGGSLNMRDTPDTASSQVVAKIPERTEISVLFRGEQWSEVLHKGTRGWVMTRYLRFD